MKEAENGRWQKVGRIWEIIDRLRGDPGCPWDRQQTPESVQTYLIEEAHEAASAVRRGLVREAADELGDLLFMVLFLIHLYEERADFRLEEVCDRICAKMIRRHPHVFGDVTVHSTQEIRDNWEKIKAEEKAAAGKSAAAKSTSGIPSSLPALMRAYRLISRSAQDADGRWGGLQVRSREFAEQSQKLADALSHDTPVPAEAFGELLLSLVNLARLSGYRAEDCLHEQLEKTIEEKIVEELKS